MKRHIRIILLAAIILAGFLLLRAGEQQVRSKVFKFSHRVHAVDNEIACKDCHTKIEISTQANDRNLPEKEICAGCHDVEDEKNCALCHADMENLQSFENPVRNYFFNHKAHISDKINCNKCHNGIENMDLGDGKTIPAQEQCNTCHNGMSATMECLTCHANNTKFRPDSHIPTWTREHMVQVRAGDADCAHCHTNNYCQECHEPTNMITTKMLPQNFYSSFSAHADGKQNLIVKSVHGLNYRFVHQLDASGKEKECSSCHETSVYCGECHNTISTPQNRPAWHGGADWGAIALGVGSGGGRHAELARRDIERCAACHDVQGADPTCLMCHSDFDGIKNTDPKTHESGFTNRFGESSSFHNDNGAVCFTCHQNTNQPGVGFCGYCHSHKN